MHVTGLHHVNVNCSNLDTALAFYRDVMGFPVMDERPDLGIAGAWLRAGAHQVHLVVRDGFSVDPAQHFALQVDDLDAWVAHLVDHGVQVRRPPHRLGAGRQAFLTDPDGNRIELNQPD
jgi:catechol 2,3-dioxygenase-like lactoylglutathione lyase family enzyme